MAKTKTVEQRGWGVFDSFGRLKKRKGYTFNEFIIHVTKRSARLDQPKSETVRPVTISWEVEE